MNQPEKRPYKGESLLAFPDDYVVLDLETTGLDPEWDEIIEISAIKFKNDSEIDRLTSLVKPAFPVGEFISDLTGITNEMLESASPLSEVFPKVIQFIGNSILVGHNVNFDVNFLYDSCLKILNTPFSNDFVDTLRISRRMFPECKHNRLSDLIVRFEVGVDVTHRAECDVLQTHACYTKLKELYKSGNYKDALNNPKHSSKYLKAKDIVADTDVLNTDSDIFGKTFCFTGTLTAFNRATAMQEVVNHGGICADGIRKDVDFLVIGGNGYKMELRNGKSKKWISAEKMRKKGLPILVISEEVFLDMLQT